MHSDQKLVIFSAHGVMKVDKIAVLAGVAMFIAGGGGGGGDALMLRNWEHAVHNSTCTYLHNAGSEVMPD